MNTRIDYKPKTLDEFVFPSDAVRAEIMQYVHGGCIEPLILYGTYGSGKTLLSELIPKAIDGENVQVTNIKAETLNNSAETRKALRRDVVFDTLFSTNDQKRNYTIVQELNNEVKACNAVRQCMDEMMGREQFIFTTNKLHNVDPGIRSRCREVGMVTAPPDRFFPRAKQILRAEGVFVPEDQLLWALKSMYESKNDNRAYYRALDTLIYTYRQDEPPRPVLRIV
jgi:DNA polymerase III delta prime subunit